MNCQQARKAIPLFLYDEVSLEQEQLLQDHLEACPECRRFLDAEKALQRALDARTLEPSGVLLAACRRQLSLRLDAAARAGGRLARLWAWLTRPAGFWPMLRRLAAATALVVLGFFAGRWIGPSPAPRPAEKPGEGEIAGIRFLEPDPSGTVRIAVEETRRRVIMGRPEDERIQRLLLAAAREAADPGLRIESVDLLRARAQRHAVRRALLEALENDPNPGVRLKALEALKPLAAQPDVREALARVLLQDRNPGVRIQVIDLLVEQGRRESLVGLLQELLNKEDNNYVRLRTQRALEELNASVGTF